MKKLLATALVVTACGGIMIGATACGEGDSSKVSEEQWVAAATMDYSTIENWKVESYETYGGSTNKTVTEREGNKRKYTSYAEDGTTVDYEYYMAFDDATMTATSYSQNDDDVWNKHASTYTATEYAQYKARYLNFLYMPETVRLAADGEDKEMKDIFSAFTYSEDDKAYTATVYIQTGAAEYSAISLSIKFDDAQIVAMDMSMGEGAAATSQAMTITYGGVTVTIPQAALDAE